MKSVSRTAANNSKTEIAKIIIAFRLKELRLKRELMKFMLWNLVN
jgi:hypothetical protein